MSSNGEEQLEKQNSVIHEWTKEQVESASKPNYGKIYVTAPNLLSLIGDIKDKEILELGCGNGFWLRLLARAGASCTGIDHAAAQIEAAQNWQDPHTKHISYRVGNVAEDTDLHDKFDIVFFEHVLLEMPDRETLESSILQATKALKQGGCLIISDMHPFAPVSRPQNLKIAEDFSYFDSGASFEIQSQRIDGEIIYYTDIHWTLEDIAQAISKAELKITNIVEPVPTSKDVAHYP